MSFTQTYKFPAWNRTSVVHRTIPVEVVMCLVASLAMRRSSSLTFTTLSEVEDEIKPITW